MKKIEYRVKLINNTEIHVFCEGFLQEEGIFVFYNFISPTEKEIRIVFPTRNVLYIDVLSNGKTSTQ